MSLAVDPFDPSIGTGSGDWVGVLGAEARGRFPEECCGVLLGVVHAPDRFEIRGAKALPNTFPGDRTRAFQMEAASVRLADKAAPTGCEIVGFFHSHPNGGAVPSESDLALASAWRGYLHAIVGTSARGEPVEVRLYRVDAPLWRQLGPEIMLRETF